MVCLLPDSSNLGQNKKHFKVLSGSEYSRALQQHRSLSALLIQAVLAHNILRIPSRSFFARSLTKSTHNLYEKRLLLRVTFDEKFRTLFYNFISNPRRSQNHFIPELILFIFIYFFSSRVTGLFSQFQSSILVPDGCAVSFLLHW